MRAVLLFAGLGLAMPVAAAIPREQSVVIGSPARDGDARIARAMERAQAGDCKGVLTLLDPVVANGAGRGSATRFSAQLLRMPCLAETGRGREIAPVLAELKQQAPGNPLVQGFQVFVDADAGRFAEAADGLGAIADARSRALGLMPGDLWRALAQKLTIAGDTVRRDRVSLALALADWEPSDQPELPEALAADGIGALLDRKAVDDARQLLGRVQRPTTLWEMAIQRRYAALWPDLEVRLGDQAGRAIDGYARKALAAYADTPQDVHATLNAARAFLLLGRPDDVATTAASTRIEPEMAEDQVSIVMADADALSVAGQRDAALARLRPFAAPEMARALNGAGALIARAEALDSASRFDEELTVARASMAHGADRFSPYGLAWLHRSEVCALGGLGRADEAKVAGDALKANAADNQAAAIEGLLCAGRDDEAAAIAIAALGTADGVDRLADQFQPDAAMFAHPVSRLHALWGRLLTRPDVKAAFDRAARVLPKNFWPAPGPRALPAPASSGDADSITT